MGPGDRDDGGGADVGPPTASPDASDLAFGASCLDNAQCASSICFEYKAKGRFCTQPCMTDQDCPAENQLMTLGCNGMGLCRVSGN